MFLEIAACEDPNILRFVYFIGEILKIAFLLIPIILILVIAIDLIKNIIINDEGKKVVSLIIKRLINVVLVFLIYDIVGFAMGLVSSFGGNEWKSCLQNVSSVDNLEIYQALYDAKMEATYQDLESDTIDVNSVASAKATVATDQIAGEDFAKAARSVWKKIKSVGFTYNAYVHHQIPITGTQCDCSSLVSWALYEYGYKDFAGKQKKTWTFYNTDWNKKYHWTVIPIKAGEDVSDKVQAGDILVRVPVNQATGKAGSGHINIIDFHNGQIVAYDCGSNDLITKGSDVGTSMVFNLQDNRPGKIIRVTKVKQGDV